MTLFSARGGLLLAGMLVVGVALALGSVLLLGGGGGESTQDGPGDGADAPLDLAGQPADIVARYRFAESHPELMAQIPCYCGCGLSLGHTSLLDCFVRSDGRGYDSHASGCFVCTEEALDIEQMLTEGKDAAAIRKAIDEEYAKYGPPTETS